MRALKAVDSCIIFLLLIIVKDREREENEVERFCRGKKKGFMLIDRWRGLNLKKIWVD